MKLDTQFEHTSPSATRRTWSRVLQMFDLEKVFVLCLSLSLFVYVMALVAYFDGLKNYLVGSSANHTAALVTEIISDDLVTTAQIAKRYATNQTFDQFITSRDLLRISDVATEEKDKSDLDVLIVVDENGVALTRTPGQQERGDYIFDTAPYGATLLLDGQVETIVHGGTNPTLLLGGALMEAADTIVGAILTGHVLGSDYVQLLQQRYEKETDFSLQPTMFGGPSGVVEIIFYSNDSGIIAQTFTDEKLRNLIHENFDTTFLTNGDNPFPLSRVTIGGQQYNVRDTELPSGTDSRIGVLTLTTHHTVGGNVIYAVLATTVFVLLLMPVFVFMRPFRSRNNRRIFATLLTLLLVGLFAIFFFRDISVQELFFDVKKPAYPIYNSTMAFNPDSGVFATQFEQRIAIAIESGGEPINAAKAQVFFDPQRVKVEEIITTNSFCESGLFIERNIDNEAGAVNISCGIRNPGFTGRSAIIAELVVQPLDTGTFDLIFCDETAVFANDGLGTQVLRFALDGSYIATDVDNTESLGDRLLLFSRTHANSERWYNTKDITFSWRKNDAEQFRYTFDDRPFTQPNGDEVTNIRELTVSAEEDGVYYFHLQEDVDGRGVGEVAHYKVQIDTTPPEPPAVRVSETTLTLGDIARFDFSSSDNGSGLQKNYYYVSFNNGILLPVQPPFYTSFPTVGTHEVKVRVFDNAENISDSIVEMTIIE